MLYFPVKDEELLFIAELIEIVGKKHIILCERKIA
jgi:3-deoxy-D-arabino-heptulosonate 7-phosphate (DAHP) synthase